MANAYIDKIAIAADTYDVNAIKTNGVFYGTVDSTSTATVFTASIEGLTELKNGTVVILHNGVVTSASGFTININDLGAKKCYNNMTNATRDTTIFNIAYTMMFIYSEDLDEGNGGWWCYRGYDANTNTIGYQLRTNSGNLVASDTGYKYRLWLTSADGSKWVPINTSTSTNATANRTLNTRPIDPFGPIVYRATNGTCTAGSGIGATGIWQQYTCTIGYSYMATGFALTFPDSVFLRCTPQSDGSAVMNDIVQALPTSKDGKIYIHLGTAYSATNMELQTEHPVYWHDGTGIRLWTGAEPSAGGSTVEVTQTLTSGTAIASIDIDGDSTTLYAPTPPTVPGASSTTPSMDGTAAVGTATTYARADHVHPTDTSRQATLVSGTNIKTVGGTSLLGSGDIPITITMEDTDVDAAVDAAWPAPPSYAITPIEGYVEMGHLLAIGLSDEVEQGEFVATASEGEMIYVMGVGDWEPQVTIDSTGTSVAYGLYGPGVSGTLYTFIMPAEAVTVSMWYND